MLSFISICSWGSEPGETATEGEKGVLLEYQSMGPACPQATITPQSLSPSDKAKA